MMRMTAIYARVSSEQQREENTIASQTASLIEFAQAHDLEVPKEWVFEDEGYSGATLERPGLERVRDLAAEGQIQVVLAYSPDRLSRKYAYQILDPTTQAVKLTSPLLANVYLHYAFDLWVQHWRRHRATGEVIVVRYADDAVMGFQHRADAEQFLRDWKERLGRFGLELHPDKTRLVEFGRYAVANRKERGEGKPETFNFLGFTHICGPTWRTGKFLGLRQTIHN